MDQLEELKDPVAGVFLKEIIRSLRSGEITVEQSKEFAVEFLKMEPYESVDDVRTKIHAFVDKYPRFGSMKTYIDSYKDEQNTNKVVELMKKHIQNDDIDQALEVAKSKIE